MTTRTEGIPADFLLERIYTLIGLPVRRIGSDGSLRASWGNGEDTDPILRDTGLMQGLLSRGSVSDQPVLEAEDNKILYGCCKCDSGDWIVLGPARLHDMDERELRQYKRTHNLPADSQLQIAACSLYRFAGALAVVSWAADGKTWTEEEILRGSSAGGTAPNTGDYAEYQLENSEQDVRRSSYLDELLARRLIMEGDVEGLFRNLPMASFEQIGKLASNSFKQYEYLAVSGITFMTRAAIDGGVKPETAYNTSDLFLQKLETCLTIQSVLALVQSASIRFTELVKAEKESKTQSSYIEQCKSYIASHLYKSITLDDLAKHTGMHRSYLSGQFTKYEGMHIREYIHRARIEAACGMLRYTDMPISAVAEYLCFHSQSHFGDVFKKYAHLTPQQYRNKMTVADLPSGLNNLIKN